jgi:hypothetical protein
MPTRSQYVGGSLRYYDSATQETVARLQPVVLDEDWLGAGHTAGIPTQGAPTAGYAWVKRIVGAGPPTVGIVANSASGIAACALAATSEKEDAALYANDQLTWDMTKRLVFETRVAFSVLPTALVEMVFGMQSAWIDGPDNASFYARFQALASGAINIQTKDGVQTLSNASGVTLAAGAFSIFRMDVSDPTNVIFSIDGAVVSAGNMSFAATGANAILQPYFAAYKASGTGVGTMQIDMIQITSNRV